MRLREGRDLSWSDREDSQPVVILNEAAAKRLWPGEDPIGRIAVVGGDDRTVVGVVSNVRETNVEDQSGPEVYLPITQAWTPSLWCARSCHPMSWPPASCTRCGL
jgi:MacB-like periplasmic core domain